jgi:hypothetical protein
MNIGIRSRGTPWKTKELHGRAFRGTVKNTGTWKLEDVSRASWRKKQELYGRSHGSYIRLDYVGTPALF